MKQDHFLMVILGVIGLLVVLAVVLFFVRQAPQDYGPDDTPGDIIRNYALALQKGDYERAYGYLQDAENKPDLAQFRQAFLGTRMDISRTAIQIGDTDIFEDDAKVEVTVIHGGQGPFESARQESNTALLTRQNGDWRILNMPYPYWGWGWYTEK